MVDMVQAIIMELDILPIKYDSEYILLSNPDVIVEENTIGELERFLKTNQNYVIAAPFMLNSDGERQLNTAFRITTELDYILSFEIIWSKYISKTFYKNILSERGNFKQVDGVSGSLLMMDTHKMLKYGMYDENIFLYCEELSLAIKLKKIGMKTALLPEQSFIHNHSVSISKTYHSELKKHKLLVKSKLYVIKYYYKASPVMYVFAWIMSRLSLTEIFVWSLFHRIKAK